MLQRNFSLRDETVFLTVNLMDRYLSMTLIDGVREMTQVATAAVLIATKYEEIYPPSGQDLLSAMNLSKSEAFTHEDLLKVEF